MSCAVNPPNIFHRTLDCRAESQVDKKRVDICSFNKQPRTAGRRNLCPTDNRHRDMVRPGRTEFDRGVTYLHLSHTHHIHSVLTPFGRSSGYTTHVQQFVSPYLFVRLIRRIFLHSLCDHCEGASTSLVSGKCKIAFGLQ